MNRQQQIELFLRDAHRLAFARLRAHPERLHDASEVLARWRDQAGCSRSDPYLNEWAALLLRGVDAIESAAGADTDHAAALRSVSPLSFLISQRERHAMLASARRAE